MIQVENRAEKAEKLKAFAVGMFYNHFSLPADQDQRSKYENAVTGIQQAQVKVFRSEYVQYLIFAILGQDLYGPRRQYKRKDAGPDDEKTRVRITLLEYGNNGLFAPKLTASVGNASKKPTDGVADEANVLLNEDDAMSGSEVYLD